MASDEQNSPQGAPLFLMRVRRKLIRIAHTRRLRSRDAHRAGLTDAEYADRLRHGDRDAIATLPGGAVVVPATTSLAVRTAVAHIFAHRFDILGSGLTELVAADGNPASARRARFEDLCGELPPETVAAYRMIEWHADVVGGYRWNPDAYYLDIPVAPHRGADIKRPRELSRFQHVGILAAVGSDDALHERAGLEVALQTMDWIAANPVRRGVNWASAMDVGIRAVNWIWALRLFDDVFAKMPRTRAHILRSLYEHGLHLEENLEYALERTTNHYLSDVAGVLYIAAALPNVPESDRWLHLGLHELVSEMRRQVYPDGGDFEASTGYHRLCTEIFLSCAALIERLPSNSLDRVRARKRETIALGPTLQPLDALDIATSGRPRVLPPPFYASLARMAELTAALTKSNGHVPQLGDNDSGRLHKLSCAPDQDVRDHRHLLAVAGALLRRSDLAERGAVAAAEANLVAGDVRSTEAPVASRELRDPIQFFPNTGIAVVRSGKAYLAATCGPNGRHGRGGHGHNDKGSFELTIGNHDYVVDGGCFVYTSDPDARNLFRSTQAHSTVWVTDREQDPLPSGLDGLFMLPEQSHPTIAVDQNGVITTEHMGFGTPHRRKFTLSDSSLLIEDTCAVPGERVIGFNLDPSVRASVDASQGECAFVLHVAGAQTVRLNLSGASAPRIDTGCFSLGYGVRISNQRLLASMHEARVTSRFEWVDRA